MLTFRREVFVVVNVIHVVAHKDVLQRRCQRSREQRWWERKEQQTCSHLVYEEAPPAAALLFDQSDHGLAGLQLLGAEVRGDVRQELQVGRVRLKAHSAAAHAHTIITNGTFIQPPPSRHQEILQV